MASRIERSDKEWRSRLTPQQYEVTRRKGTEPPFTGKYYDFHAKGTYRCVCCGHDLFSSEAKFDSGTGWPSFCAPISDEMSHHHHRHLARDDPDRGEVRAVRCPSGPRV